MKRLLPMLLALALAACAALGPRLKMPELKVDHVVPTELGLAQQRFAVTLTGENGNDRSITLDAVEVELRSGGALLARATSSVPVTLPAHGRGRIELNAATSTAQWLAALGRLKADDLAAGLPYTLTGRARIQGWGWLPFRASGRWSPMVPAPAERAQH